MNQDALDLATDDELIDALARRFEHLVLSGSRMHEHTTGAQRERWHWKGHHRLCQGMCASLSARIEEDFRRREQPEPPAGT